MVLKRLLKWQLMILFLAVAFCLQYILISRFLPEFYKFSAGAKNPDQLFWYTKQTLERLYSILGTDGRIFYQKMLVIDFFYAGFASAGYTILLYLLSKNTKWTWVSVAPLFMTLFDYLENISQIILLNKYPGVSAVVAFFSSVFSLLKMSLSGIGIILVILFIIRLIVTGVIKIKR
jgi:hypothetical protein